METNPNPDSLPEETLVMPKRPAYLGLLAGYLAIYGGILFALQLYAYKNIMASGVALDYSPTLLLISIIFLGVLGIVAGSGLWWGKKWGWWLSAFYFLYALAREVNTLFTAGSQGAEGTRSLLSAGLGMLLSIVVLLYLYSHEILAHFHLEKFPRWISLLILLVVSAVVTLVF